MKTRLIIALVVLAMLFSFACKKKADTSPGKEVAEQITAFAPLPSFKLVYAALDRVQVKDIAQAVPSSIYQTQQEEVRNAFSLGLLTADAVLAAKGRDKNKLNAISTQMMKLTDLLGLQSQISRLGDDLKRMIEKGDWDSLEEALDAHKEDVEFKLWDSEDFDNYTLMLFGGWVEAANRIAWIIERNYSAQSTNVLNQKGTFNSLMDNLDLISAEHIVQQEAFKKAVALAKELQAVINSDTEGTYSKEQLNEIIEISAKIKAAFQE